MKYFSLEYRGELAGNYVLAEDGCASVPLGDYVEVLYRGLLPNDRGDGVLFSVGIQHSLIHDVAQGSLYPAVLRVSSEVEAASHWQHWIKGKVYRLRAYVASNGLVCQVVTHPDQEVC